MLKLLFLCLASLSLNLDATTLKIAALAPEGTTWAETLKKMAKEIENKTNGEVKIKLYMSGSQGDEPDVLRKIRVGQLQGGIFTGKTLGAINGDARVMEIPFTFYDDNEKAYNTLNELEPHLNRGFKEKGFENLGFYEIGNVYFVSQEKTESLEELKGLKIWSWEGDRLVEAMIETLDLVSVPLPLPDVLSSLSTGVVKAAYAPPLGILALQWSSEVKYLVDFPLSYSIGAFLVASKSWKKISKENQKLVKEISKKYVLQVNKSNTLDNQEALKAMENMGIKFLDFPEKDQRKAKKIRKKIIEKLKGNLFSEKIYKRFKESLEK